MHTPTPDETVLAHDQFEAIVETLRRDFWRLFPHLRELEHECFFVSRNDDGLSGKVWIEFDTMRNGETVRRRITMIIKENRPVRRLEEVVDSHGQLENTDFVII
jgi:hypothetical protein